MRGRDYKHNHAQASVRMYSKSGEVRLDASAGIGVQAYLQLSFSVCCRWLFARAWWVSMEKTLPQKQVPSRRGALRTLPRPLRVASLEIRRKTALGPGWK